MVNGTAGNASEPMYQAAELATANRQLRLERVVVNGRNVLRFTAEPWVDDPERFVGRRRTAR